MDPEDLLSHLRALRKLYGLLISDVECLQNNRPEILDERVRFLLKDLLDGAFEKILKFTSEDVLLNLGVFNTSSETQQQKPQSPMLPFLLSNASNTSLNDFQRTDKELNSLATDLPKGQITSPKQTQPALVLSQVSSPVVEPQNKKKRCRVCMRSTSKQLKSSEMRNLSVEEPQNMDKATICLQPQPYNKYQADGVKNELTSNSKALVTGRSNETQCKLRMWEFQSIPNRNKISMFPSNIDATGIVKSVALQNITEGIGKTLAETDFISKEASDAIRIIDLRISALQVGSQRGESLEKNTTAQHGVFEFSSGSVSGIGAVCPVMLNRQVTKNDPVLVGQFVIGRKESNDHLINRRKRDLKDSTGLRQIQRKIVRVAQLAKNSLPQEPFNGMNSKLTSPSGRKGNGISLRHDTFSQVGESSGGHIVGTPYASVLPNQNVTAVVEKIESMSQNSNTESKSLNIVQEDSISLNLDRNAKKDISLAKLPSKTKKENVDGNQSLYSVAGSTDVLRLDRKSQVFDTGNKLIRTKTRVTAPNGKVLPHRTTKKKPQRDRKHDQYMVYPGLYRDKIDEGRSVRKMKKNHDIMQRLSLSDQQESEDASPSQGSSSSWATHQGSTTRDDSEEYSEKTQTQSQQQSVSTNGSESEVSYRPSRTRGHHSGSRNDSYSEVYSVSSTMDYNSSSENGGYLPSDQTSGYSSLSIPSRRLDRTSSYRSANRKRSEKRIGRLRKLKDKLAIIFHHHHHHHHHHHYSDDDDRSNQKPQGNHGKSLWKNAGKLFHRKTSDENYGENAADKLRKSMAYNVRHKKQGGNFHSLVDAFMRHIRHSKKSEKPIPKQDSFKRLGKDHHISKKVIKKVHWWQLLRHHGGVKMPKRPRVKLRFGNKKPQLQTLRTIKWR